MDLRDVGVIERRQRLRFTQAGTTPAIIVPMGVSLPRSSYWPARGPSSARVLLERVGPERIHEPVPGAHALSGASRAAR
jgi:hypothetical protein